MQLYEQGMEEMKVLNVEAYKWLHELEPQTWVKPFQSDLPKCDILLNNICEVFNRYICEVCQNAFQCSELPILTMVCC